MAWGFYLFVFCIYFVSVECVCSVRKGLASLRESQSLHPLRPRGGATLSFLGNLRGAPPLGPESGKAVPFGVRFPESPPESWFWVWGKETADCPRSSSEADARW